MKLELATAKIRNGATGTFRALKPGEPIQDGDIMFHLTFACDVNEKNVGEPVKKGEAIIRLEFDSK